MLGSVARTTSHLSNPVDTFAHNFFHRLRVSIWRYYSYYYYIFSESCAALTAFSAGIGLLTAPFFIAAVALGIVFFSLIIIIISYYSYYYFLFSLSLSYYFSYSFLIFSFSSFFLSLFLAAVDCFF